MIDIKKLYRILFILHVFVGLGGMVGGLASILNPLEPLGAPVELLKNSPFSNFLIPGIILFTVIGLGNIVSAIGICFKFKYQGYISSVFSCALAIWIVVQCIMLNLVLGIHVFYFVIGVIMGILSIIIVFKDHLFPTNIVLQLYKRVIGKVQ